MATCFGAALTLGCLPRFMISGKLTQVCWRMSIYSCAFASTSVCLHSEDGMFLMIDPGSSRADKHHQRERWCIYRGQESRCHSCSSVSVGIYDRFVISIPNFPYRLELQGIMLISISPSIRVCVKVGACVHGSPDSVLCPENVAKVYGFLHNSMNDYTVDRRGDVGAWSVNAPVSSTCTTHASSLLVCLRGCGLLQCRRPALPSFVSQGHQETRDTDACRTSSSRSCVPPGMSPGLLLSSWDGLLSVHKSFCLQSVFCILFIFVTH